MQSGLPLGPPLLLLEIMCVFHCLKIEFKSSRISGIKQYRMQSRATGSEVSTISISVRSIKKTSPPTNPVSLKDGPVTLNPLILWRCDYAEGTFYVTSI